MRHVALLVALALGPAGLAAAQGPGPPDTAAVAGEAGAPPDAGAVDGGPLAGLADDYFLWLLAYAAVYFALFLVPFVRSALGPKPGADLQRLLHAIGEAAAAARPAAAPDAEEPAAGDGAPPVPQRAAAERLAALPALRLSFESPLVRDAVAQLRASYPGGAYQRVEVETLPAYAVYAERAAAARNMAGLFVLIGLLLTMVRLNGVVGRIGGAAGAAAMNSADFLDAMSAIMTGIGGAFDSSIWGLGLMVASLLVVGVIDLAARRRVDDVDEALTREIVPALADLHERLMPNLTLADLMAETGAHLRTLSRTVRGLTHGLDHSLAGLGERIAEMLADFRSFQEQYVRLNDLLALLKDASANLSRTTKGLEGASTRLTQPLDEFNRTVLAHLETVADAVAGNRELAEEMAAVRAHTDDVVGQLKALTQARLAEAGERHEASLAALEAQGVAAERQLQRVAAALEKASNVQIGATLAQLDQTVGRLSRRLSGEEEPFPPTLFAWTAGLVRRRGGRRNGR
jgi:hypothetical protein